MSGVIFRRFTLGLSPHVGGEASGAVARTTLAVHKQQNHWATNHDSHGLSQLEGRTRETEFGRNDTREAAHQKRRQSKH